MNLIILSALLLTGFGNSSQLPSQSDSLNMIPVAEFSQLSAGENEHPPKWDTMNFTGISRTSYSLVEVDGKTAVKAESEQSSSGLVREIEIDLKEYPVMRWTWRTENTFENGNVNEKNGDDYPARLYLLFDYGIKNLPWGLRQRIRILRTFYGRVPTRAINYIWESNEPVGTMVENPYTRLVTMVVVESGEDNLGKWVTYERNVYEDYKAIYGEEPPSIGGVAIMTDSDDTGESAVAYFGDISFHRE